MLHTLCSLLICGSTILIGGEPATKEKRPGFDSPEEAWEAYRHAHHEGRWRDAFRCLTSEHQEKWVGQIVFVAAYLQDTEEKCAARKLEEILKNHGLDLKHIETDTSRVSHGKVDDYVKDLNRRMQDVEGLYDEAMTVLSGVMPQPTAKDGKRMIALGALTKIEALGDRARGKYMKQLDDRTVFEADGVRKTELEMTVAFRKRDGRWFVDSDD